MFPTGPASSGREPPRDTGRVPSPPPMRHLAAPLGGALVLGHADGFSWDEALMVLAPIAIIAAVLLYVNRKLKLGIDRTTAEQPVGDETARHQPPDPR
jgi:hypothetical protein